MNSGNHSVAATSHSLPILLVEDNDDDAFFMRRAFKTISSSNPIFHVTDGQEAVDYLSGKGTYSDRGKFPLPFLILLDLKMPRLNGFDVLKWIRKHETSEINSLIVIILSSSNQAADLADAQELGANSYEVKPTDFDSLVVLVKKICDFWIGIPTDRPAVTN